VSWLTRDSQPAERFPEFGWSQKPHKFVERWHNTHHSSPKPTTTHTHKSETVMISQRIHTSESQLQKYFDAMITSLPDTDTSFSCVNSSFSLPAMQFSSSSLLSISSMDDEDGSDQAMPSHEEERQEESQMQSKARSSPPPPPPRRRRITFSEHIQVREYPVTMDHDDEGGEPSDNTNDIMDSSSVIYPLTLSWEQNSEHSAPLQTDDCKGPPRRLTRQERKNRLFSCGVSKERLQAEHDWWLRQQNRARWQRMAM